MFRLRSVLLSTLALPLAPVSAQEVPPAPAASPTPEPIPSPTPATPLLLPAPSPTTVVEEAPLPRPSPRATATPSPTPTPAVVARPTPTPAPIPTTTPTSVPVAPVPTPTSPAERPSIVSPLPTDDDRGAVVAFAWPWMLGAGLLLVGGIGVWLARRRRGFDGEEIGAPSMEQGQGVVVAPVDATTLPMPALVLRFRPSRVGFNMLSATVEGELTIANEGAAPVADIRVRTGLLGAHAGQDADLAEFLAAPIGRPVVPAFALTPGEERTIRIVAPVARQAMRTLVAAGRPIFVPVVVADVRLADGTQVAQGFAIGAERVDSARLAPFWLDVPDRTYGEVAARPHGPTVVRRG